MASATTSRSSMGRRAQTCGLATSRMVVGFGREAHRYFGRAATPERLRRESPGPLLCGGQGPSQLASRASVLSLTTS